MKKIEVYTDGAVSNNGYENAVGGWAYTIYVDNKLTASNYGRLEGATNQQMELRAMIEGCKEAYALAQTLGNEVDVYSDSAYCINCYNQKWYKGWRINGWKNARKQLVANKELWEELIYYFEAPFFHFYKVKGHANDKRNNEVDKMAVLARMGGSQ